MTMGIQSNYASCVDRSYDDNDRPEANDIGETGSLDDRLQQSRPQNGSGYYGSLLSSE